MVSFIHFNMNKPQPKTGVSFEEYVPSAFKAARADADERAYFTPRESYKRTVQIFKIHRPPMGIRGIYAYVNTPQNIDVRVLPSDVKEYILSMARNHAKDNGLIEGSFEYLDFVNKEFYELLKMKNADLDCAYQIPLNWVRRIWIHLAVNAKWINIKVSEFEHYYDSLTDKGDLYEVFLELKS